MDYAEYDRLIQRSNEINAAKQQLLNMIDRGKNIVRVNGKRMKIADRIKQLNEEHTDIIRQINESHDR
jgi:4-hydroxy-3-methylbut-2-en-1-yl diphosphate synthase IspG/GcpE